MIAVKKQPATPLPWHRISTMGGEYLTAQNSGASLERAKVVYRIAKAARRQADAAYILHAANAYPKLVAALRKVLPFIDDAADVHTIFPDSAASYECREEVAAVHALLRELGETS